MSEWRDISTAPKDGTRFLAMLSYGDGVSRIVVVSYDVTAEKYKGGDYGPFVWALEGRGEVARDIATHWMPLPEAPK